MFLFFYLMRLKTCNVNFNMFPRTILRVDLFSLPNDSFFSFISIFVLNFNVYLFIYFLEEKRVKFLLKTANKNKSLVHTNIYNLSI